MRDKASLRRGYVRLTNEAGQTVEARNLVVYTGGDILAKLLAGDMDYQIGCMYFGFENTLLVPVPIVPARADTAALFHAFVAPRDFIRAPVLSPPAFSASDANHNFNQATFVAVTTASVGELGVPFGSANNSQVFHLGLLATPTTVYTDDVLYAEFSLPTPLPAVGSGQISATWMQEAD